MPTRLALVALLLLGAGVVRAAPPQPPDEHLPDVTKAELMAWVKALSDDAIEGRESGEPGCDKASELIAAEFTRLGLRPMGDAGTFFQQFTIPRGMKVLRETSLAVLGADGKETTFKLADEFVPVDVSAAGDVTAEVVFAGYGIRAPEFGYDDYADHRSEGEGRRRAAARARARGQEQRVRLEGRAREARDVPGEGRPRRRTRRRGARRRQRSRDLDDEGAGRPEAAGRRRDGEAARRPGRLARGGQAPLRRARCGL